jgi:hypothetical protein
MVASLSLEAASLGLGGAFLWLVTPTWLARPGSDFVVEILLVSALHGVGRAVFAPSLPGCS